MIKMIIPMSVRYHMALQKFNRYCETSKLTDNNQTEKLQKIS